MRRHLPLRPRGGRRSRRCSPASWRRYDLMNRLMTGGSTGAGAASPRPRPSCARATACLDVCCGTGDLAFTAARRCPACAVTGLDFTEAMLDARAREGRGAATPRPSRACDFVCGDALRLPFRRRRLRRRHRGLRRAQRAGRAARVRGDGRVTAPGGRVVCLELTQTPARHGTALSRPLVRARRAAAWPPGRRRRAAYSYLPASVAAFPRAERAGRHHGRRRPGAGALPALRLRRRGPARREAPS